jgi:diguanylate cyclase (GGDEF)-like protein
MSEANADVMKVSKNPKNQSAVDKINKELTGDNKQLAPEELLKINTFARNSVATKLTLEKVRKERSVAKEKTMIDELTKLPNARWFKDALKISKNRAARALFENTQENETSERHGKGFFLIMFDIDNFKHVNDTRGHLEGDKALRLIGELEKRANEPIARIGGDEFAEIVNGGMSEEDLGKLLGRYRKQYAELTEKAGLTPLTLSFGVALYRKGYDENLWKYDADKTMYAAKKAGRNKIFISDGIADNTVKTRELIIT